MDSKTLLISSIFLFLSGCGCTGNLLFGNAGFEKDMQQHIGDHLKDKISINAYENLLESRIYESKTLTPNNQSLTQFNEGKLLYKSDRQPFINSNEDKCNVSLVINEKTMVIEDFIYVSERSACKLDKHYCGPW